MSDSEALDLARKRTDAIARQYSIPISDSAYWVIYRSEFDAIRKREAERPDEAKGR